MVRTVLKYSMVIRTVFKYSRGVRILFKYSMVVRIVFKYNMVVSTVFKYSRVVRTVFKYSMVFRTVHKYSRFVCTVFKYSRAVRTVFKYSRVSVQNVLSSSLLSKNLRIKIYRIIILPVVLCGCETWSLTLREERRLRVFENRVLRRIFGPKRDEVTGEWRKLHNAELNNLYSSSNIVRVIKSRRMRWAGHVARMGDGRVVYRVLVGKPEGRRPLGRPRRRWEDNIRMDLRGSAMWVCGLDGASSG